MKETLCVVGDLQSDSVLMFSLHVVDVPGHCCHRVDRILHHLVALLLRVKVFRYLLQKTSPTTISKSHVRLRISISSDWSSRCVGVLPGAAGGIWGSSEQVLTDMNPKAVNTSMTPDGHGKTLPEIYSSCTRWALRPNCSRREENKVSNAGLNSVNQVETDTEKRMRKKNCHHTKRCEQVQQV